MKTQTYAAAAAVMAAAIQLTAPPQAHAQADAAPAPIAAAAPPATAPDARVIPAGTPIEIEIDELVSSRSAKPGDLVRLHLAQPIQAQERVLAPAGTPGVAQVIHVAHAGGAGKPGELILMARYLEVDGQRIPLGHLHLGGQGHNRDNLALATAVAAGPAAFLIRGGEIVVPVGTQATAQVVAETPLRAAESKVQPESPQGASQ